MIALAVNGHLEGLVQARVRDFGPCVVEHPRSQYVALGAYDRRLCVREEVPQDLGRKPGYRQVYLAPAQTDLYGVPGPDRAWKIRSILGLPK